MCQKYALAITLGYAVFQMAEAAFPRQVFAGILDLIKRDARAA